MNDETNTPWERELVTKLATAALKEQRRARLWGIFFKLLTFAYISIFLVMAVGTVLGLIAACFLPGGNPRQHTVEAQAEA